MEREIDDEVYQWWKKLHEFLDLVLFLELLGKNLPRNCLVQFSSRSIDGHFAPYSGTRPSSKEKVHYIGLNSEIFHEEPAYYFGVIVRMMCHLYQFEHGKPGRKMYVNKELSKMMQTVGIKPVNLDDREKRTGEKMTQEVISGGKLDAVLSIMESKFPPPILPQYVTSEEERKKSNKKLYQCPECGKKMYGNKSGETLFCGDCAQKQMDKSTLEKLEKVRMIELKSK